MYTTSVTDLVNRLRQHIYMANNLCMSTTISIITTTIYS